MGTATILLASTDGFIPEERCWIDLYLWVLGLYFIPRFGYRLCVFLGRIVKASTHSRSNWGRPIGLLLALILIVCFVIGMTIGPRQLKERRIDINFNDLPSAFDGYTIVLCSDLHLGSQSETFVSKLVETVNRQRADMICFAGDIQNTTPQELYPYVSTLRTLQARDGVYSVLGNHDYSYYMAQGDPSICMANERETISLERQMGWKVLLNGHEVVSRNGQHVNIAGEECYSKKAGQPSKSDLGKTLEGIGEGEFTILLQHNPAVWNDSILTHSDVQLTLSGHTHGGQMSLMGLRPTMKQYREDRGFYGQGDQKLYVTSGLGGLISFRFAMPPEIVVITLHRKG